MKRKLNWKKGINGRCKFYKYKDQGPLPPAVDLRPACPPVLDQGQLGSCTANAVANGWSFLEFQAIKKNSNVSEEFIPGLFTPPSRLFLYWQERNIEGDINSDDGADAFDGVQSLIDIGCCDETVWPYDTTQFETKPSDAAYAEAALHKITDYAELKDAASMKQCLMNGLPFVLGMDCFVQLDQVDSGGVLAMPGFLNRRRGGHEVLCVGYDDVKQVWIIMNSWGTDWGDNGYFYMPYAYMEKYCSEFIVLMK